MRRQFFSSLGDYLSQLSDYCGHGEGNGHFYDALSNYIGRVSEGGGVYFGVFRQLLG